MRLLVTGGTGFIGSHLAMEGRRRDAEVVVLGLDDRAEEQANIALLKSAGAEIIPGSITDPPCAPGPLVAAPIFFILRSRCVRVARRMSSSSGSTSTGRAACSRLPRRRIERFVYCSTIGIYGHRAPGVTREDSPLAPGNIYERTKVAGEQLVREFAAKRGLPVVILRPANVYGPRDMRLLKLFRGVSRGSFPIFGSGDGRRHMVYVDDVVSAFFKACDRPGAVGEGLIVAGPEVCTLRELIEVVRRTVGSRRAGVPAASGADARGGRGRGGRLQGAPRRPTDLSPSDGFFQ